MLSHASNRGINLDSSLSFSGAGRYGVFLFFVLSAFLLTRQFLESRPGKVDIKAYLFHYFTRRFLRIYPLFLVALMVYYLFYSFGMPIFAIDGQMLVKSLLLLDARGMFWTVPIEFQYYFILPAVALFLIALEGRLMITCMIFICFVVLWGHFFPAEYSKHLLPFLPVFLIGSLAAYIYTLIANTMAEMLWQGRYQYIIDIVACIALLCFLMLVPNIYNHLFGTDISRGYFHKEFVMWGILAAALILFTLLGKGVVYRIMTSRFMVFWGKISFSAYLGHIIILTLLLKITSLTPAARWLLFFPLSAGLFYLSYYYIERPLSTIHHIRSMQLIPSRK